MTASAVIVDFLSLSIAVFSGFLSWHLINPTIPPLQSSMFLAVGFSVAAFTAYDMYPGIGRTAVEQLRLLCRGVTLSYLLLLVSMFLVKEWWAYSRGGIVVSWLFSLLLVPAGRQFLGTRSWWGVPVIVIGTGQAAGTLIRNLRSNQDVGYRPVACLDDEPDRTGVFEGVPVIGRLDYAATLAEIHQIRYAIVATPSADRLQLVRDLQALSSIFPNVIVVPDLFGISSLWIETRDLGGLLAFEIRHNLLNRHSRWIKRATDILLSILGIALAIPLVAVAAVLISAVSPGPVFYTQQRDGRGRQSILVLKLRTMYTDAEKVLESYLDDNPSAREEWEQFCKLRNDPRILPRIGHFLRQTSLDEIPQLWNVLMGEMSLVGPRPFPSYHNDRFDEDFRTFRTQVTPGLTGLWQISARSDGDLSVQKAIDSYYIRNWSLWLDLYILIGTVRAVVARKGAC